ncbi:MAG: phosphatidate cytidylyltransferase [Planctomycetota bacterium]
MTPDAPAPAAASRRAKILRRTRVGATLALAVVGILWAASLPQGPSITLGVATVVTLWSIFELQRMRLFRTRFGAPAATVAALACAALVGRAFVGEGAAGLFDGTADPGRYWAALALAIAGGLVAGLAALGPALLGASAAGGDDTSGDVPRPAPHVVLVAMVALPLFALVPIRTYGGIAALASYLVLAKIGDIAGYYFGSLMGKRHPFPNISPGKTVAGCVASLVAGTAVGGVLVAAGALEGARFGVASGLLLGAAVNVLAQAGDLAESVLKRRAKVKDSGTTFGPSGGMLDLVDSLLLTAVPIAFLWPLLFRWPA